MLSVVGYGVDFVSYDDAAVIVDHLSVVICFIFDVICRLSGTIYQCVRCFIFDVICRLSVVQVISVSVVSVPVIGDQFNPTP